MVLCFCIVKDTIVANSRKKAVFVWRPRILQGGAINSVLDLAKDAREHENSTWGR